MATLRKQLANRRKAAKARQLIAKQRQAAEKKAQKTKNPRKRGVGRPRGHKRKAFEQTLLGYFLQHETPIEYKLLMETVEYLKLRAPSAELIEAIAYASDDAAFSKARFWNCLKNYKKWGLRPPVAAKSSVERELFYVRQRMKVFLGRYD